MLFNTNGGGEQKLKKSTGNIEARQEKDYYIINEGLNPEDIIDLWAVVITLPDGLKYYDVKAVNIGIYMRYYYPLTPYEAEEIEAAFLIMYDAETDIYTLVDSKNGDIFGTSDYSSSIIYDESEIVIGCDPELISYNHGLDIFTENLIGNVYY